jgi:hypothetical protein
MRPLLHDENSFGSTADGADARAAGREVTAESLDQQAQDALETARQLPHGALRSEAMKKAGKLRVAADQKRKP